jgi:hypothetical protein
MLLPSRADLAAEAVFASLNCTRAWDRRYSRQVQNQATLTTNKQTIRMAKEHGHPHGMEQYSRGQQQ